MCPDCFAQTGLQVSENSTVRLLHFVNIVGQMGKQDVFGAGDAIVTCQGIAEFLHIERKVVLFTPCPVMHTYVNMRLVDYCSGDVHYYSLCCLLCSQGASLHCSHAQKTISDKIGIDRPG